MGKRARRLRHHLLYLTLRLLLALGACLPLWILRPIGRWFGSLALLLSSVEKRRTMEHLAIAFPETDHARRRRILRQMVRHFGQMLGEVVYLWGAPPRRINTLYAMNGVEHLTSALEAGRGAVLVTGHCGNWELMNAALGLSGIPMTVAVRTLFDPRLDRIATVLRARFGTEVVFRGRHAGRQLAAALASNRVVGLLIDQDIKDIPGVFVPFFGQPAWTPSGAATLALRANAPVIPAFAHRRPDGTHQVDILPPLPPPSSPDHDEAVRELTAAATAAIETQIRKHPGQWVWMHRRWRTRPAETGRGTTRETP
ncbi:MAG: lysophospholipid acyltransferase family protein [Acidobacteria bacterium]|nr:lysophospholipid acyltransferase family protein [Acidobacteriota bacterium]